MGIQLSGQKMVRLLEKNGFVLVSQKGSHIKMRKIDGKARTTLIVPDHKIIKPGTLQNILKTARLSKQDIR